MTRSGSLAYYLAAWICGCFFMSVLIWLKDLVGAPLATVAAPSTGVVLFVVTSPAIKKDGLLLAVGAY